MSGYAWESTAGAVSFDGLGPVEDERGDEPVVVGSDDELDGDGGSHRPVEQEKLLRAHYTGAVPLELLKRKQDRITASLETIQNRIDAHHGEHAFARANLNDSLTLLSNAGDL